MINKMFKLLILLGVITCVKAQQTAVTDAVVKVRAVEHGEAIIPCGSSKIFLDGPDAFISWVKDDSSVVYRFPTKDSNRDEKSFNEICYQSPDMKPCHERTSLFLPHVTKDDAGFYRCRIHYNASPLVDFDFLLTVVDKPGYPKVYLENGTAVDNDSIGPIALGTNVTLVCEVEDVHESSVVQWEHNGHRVAGSELVEPGLHRAVLNLHTAQREMNGARYACITQPADVTLPLTKEVEIKMYLPPLLIKIDLNDNYHFEEGVPRAIDCVIKGFIPTPTVEWYLDDKILKHYTHQEIPKHNVMISTLTLVTKRSDDNRLLSCRAKNEYFNEVFSNSVRLTVGIKPKCVLKSKHRLKIKPNVVEKLVCVVDSDPRPLSFTWTFPNNKIVATPVQDTEIPTRFKTVLSWIPKNDDIGKLNCTATNYYGKQEEPCQFDIDRPDCTNERGAKVPCKKVTDDNFNRAKKLFDEVEKPVADKTMHYLINKIDKSSIDALDFDAGSDLSNVQSDGTDLKVNDGMPWWIPTLLFLLGSLFMLGILGYSFGHCIMIQCKDCKKDSVAMAYYCNRNRSSPSSQSEICSYRREPDVIERFPPQANVTFDPTTIASTRNAPTFGNSSIYPESFETHSYYV